jgi:hypothetical protein
MLLDSVFRKTSCLLCRICEKERYWQGKNEEQGNPYDLLRIMYWKNRGKILTLSGKQSRLCLFFITC